VAALRFAVRFEPWLTLLAAPPLVLREIFPPPAQVAALAWIAALWIARRRVTGRWTVRTVLDVPVAALLLTLPGAAYAARAAAPDIGLAAAASRAESLVFAVALAYALANAVATPRRLWAAVTWLFAAALGLVGVGLVGIDWLPKYAALTPVLARLPRVIGAVPHATLPAYGVAGEVTIHPNSIAALLILFLPLAVACLARPGQGGRGGNRNEAGDGGDVGGDTGGAGGEAVEATGGMEAAGGEANGGRDAAGGEPPTGALDLRPPRWIRPLAALVLLSAGPLVVLTQSRGAWMGLSGALVAMAAARFRPVRGILAGAALAAVVLAGAVGPAELAARLGESGLPGAASAPGRLRLWRESVALLEASPVLGIGLNTFVVAHGRRPEYGGAFVYQGAPHAHNVLLQAALDYGLPGMAAVAGLYTALGWAAWRAHRRLAGTPAAAVVAGLSFGLLAHALHGLVDAVAIGAKAGFLPWAVAGALAGVRARAGRWRGGRGPGIPAYHPRGALRQ